MTSLAENIQLFLGLGHTLEKATDLALAEKKLAHELEMKKLDTSLRGKKNI